MKSKAHVSNLSNIDVYSVVGDCDVGKSTILRSLSGFGFSSANQSWREIRLANGMTASLFIDSSTALQEPSWHTRNPKDFIQFVQQQKNPYPPNQRIVILVALRMDTVNVSASYQGKFNLQARYPDAQTYLDAFVNVGWNVQAVAHLGVRSTELTIPSGNVRAFPGKRTPEPSNVTAAKIRKFFGWV